MQKIFDAANNQIEPAPRLRRDISQVRTWTAASGLDLRKAALRQLLPLALVFGLIAVMWDKIAQLDVAYIQASLKTVAPWQWLAATAFTAISFWALGR